MSDNILLMLYKEYGGKSFFDKNKKKAREWLNKSTLYAQTK